MSDLFNRSEAIPEDKVPMKDIPAIIISEQNQPNEVSKTENDKGKEILSFI
jgi:hypothetical protein